MMSKNEQNLLNSKEIKKIERLEKKVATLERQKATLKERNEKLKLDLVKKNETIQKLQLQLVKEGKVKEQPVKRLHRLYPDLARSFSLLCREWNIKTMNMRNTTIAIFRLIEPDDNGVVEYKAQDILEYIEDLRRLGKAKYMSNPTLAEYYSPYDSLVLFKHFKNIRRNLHWEQIGFRTGYVSLDGMVIEPKRTTAVCSWEDLRGQRRGVAHPNDQVNIEEFKGDDLVRERARRELKLSGVFNEQTVRDRMRYQADRYFGRDKMTEQILAETEIIEDDDDININDFKEVK